MKNRFLVPICGFLIVIFLCAFFKPRNSTFSIQFIDVGQGDSALVECDGHYMLIDGGDVDAGKKVYKVLEEKGIQVLDILAISHLHKDHYGGLIKVLTYASTIRDTICNSDTDGKDEFKDLEDQLRIDKSKIRIPKNDETLKLGSADIRVIDAESKANNDSLVLLITYGKTRFLFTGDIEYPAQKRIADKYQGDNNNKFEVDLMKIPHHGSDVNTDLNRFITVFMPKYAIISVGAGNKYGHPSQKAIDLLDQAKVKVYRTDKDGDIIVRSDGKKLTFETSKS